MTGTEERALLRDYMDTCARLRDGLERAIQRAARLMPIGAADMDGMASDDEDLILAYLKRYEQFEDALGRSIKTVAQIMALGKVERLHPRDVANKAEAYRIVESADVWSEAVRVRNALAHEYPLRPDKRAKQINDAWRSNEVLAAAWIGLQAFVEREGLL